MGLIENCEQYFGSRNLYDVLGIPKDSSEVELKRAYKKGSLLCHPDRVDDDKKEEATRKFQTLSKVHSILSDKEQRAVYDETGCIDEENSGDEDRDWMNYFRFIFPRITKKDIEDFKNKYIGSSEEIEDLKKYYIRYEGDMDKVFECLIGYAVDEEEKYERILRDLIEKDEVPDFPSFTKESKAKKNRRIKKYKKEAAECQAEAEKVKKMTEDESLVNAIMKRSEKRESNFDNMIKNLEAKYGGNKSKNSKKRKEK